MNGRNLNTPITNTQDIIDSRDIIERIDRLERDEDRDEDEDAELEALHALAEQGADYCDDWQYGEVLIHDAYFVTYAQDFADDIGAINRDAAWPLSHIDWDAAADDLRQDYTALDFDGATYWAR